MRNHINQVNLVIIAVLSIELTGCGALMVWDLQREAMNRAIDQQRMIAEERKMQFEERKRQFEDRERQAEFQKQQQEMAAKWYNSLTSEQKFEIMMEERKAGRARAEQGAAGLGLILELFKRYNRQ